MNQFIYLSHFLDEDTPGYGGAKSFERKPISEISKGATSNSEEWIFRSNHVGTHVDLPSHFDNEGKRLEDFSASDWVFHRPHLLTLTVNENQIIEPIEVFDSIPKDCDLLLLKTNFQKFRHLNVYWEKGPGLSPDLGKWIRKNRPSIKVVGFDFISVTSYSNRPLGRVAHKEFLGTHGQGEPLRVIEDMKLDLISTNPIKIIVAPHLVRGADGAPVVVLAETGRGHG